MVSKEAVPGTVSFFPQRVEAQPSPTPLALRRAGERDRWTARNSREYYCRDTNKKTKEEAG